MKKTALQSLAVSSEENFCFLHLLFKRNYTGFFTFWLVLQDCGSPAWFCLSQPHTGS